MLTLDEWKLLASDKWDIDYDQKRHLYKDQDGVIKKRYGAGFYTKGGYVPLLEYETACKADFVNNCTCYKDLTKKPGDCGYGPANTTDKFRIHPAHPLAPMLNIRRII